MKIEITKAQQILLPMLISEFTKQAEEKQSGMLQSMAKELAPIAFEIMRDEF